jgi:NADH dehydrogenase [ubiquinone] 1 alpha subcomplex assembly factor 7
MTPLEAEIRRMIAADGPLPLGQFMTLCLAHPVHGYYVTRDPLGAAGDFVTAPEISQMFGELIGLWAACVWRQMGAPARLRLVELGPGRGTLMADALRAANVVPAFRAALEIDLVETSPALRRRQQETLAGLEVPLAWHRELGEVPDGPLIVIANEFFDALAIEQMVRAADGWHLRMVGISPDGRLVLALDPEPLRRVDAIVPATLRGVPAGSIFEWRPDRVAGDLAARLVRSGGAALVIDYGHQESAIGQTLQAVGRHAFADVLDAPGEVDLTAHVDFAALGRTAAQAGARVHGPLAQGEFLRRIGIEARTATLKAAADPAQSAAIGAALVRLVGTGTDQMGALFKVVGLADPRLGSLPGFDRSPSSPP